MAELERRLQAVAAALDAEAPTFDPQVLRAARRPRLRAALVALAVAGALLAVAAAPAAVSALRDLFSVEPVPELGTVPTGVAPPYGGRRTSLDEAGTTVPFRLRTIRSLGAPEAAYVRDDIVGGMVTLVYGSTLLTQWRADDVHAHVAFVPATGTADEVTIGSRRAVWVAGTARGTLTLVGADRAVHRELVEVSDGTLFWEDGPIVLLLQGVSGKADAIRLAEHVGP
jgi:hypothetical protein